MKTGMKTRAVLDIRDLPEYAFGHRSILWWGTLGSSRSKAPSSCWR